jgi:hypothetical protein
MRKSGVYPMGKGGLCLGLAKLSTSFANILEILGGPISFIPKGLPTPVKG